MLFILEFLLTLLLVMTILVTMVWSAFLLIKMMICKSEEKKHKTRKKAHNVMIVLDIGITIMTTLLVYWWIIARSFYCVSENKCVTVLKRNGYCYIIPGKYYGIFSPKDNYVKTDNLVELSAVIWTDDDRLVVDINPKYEREFVSQCSQGKPIIEDYHINKAINDSIYIFFNGEYNAYKKDVDFIYLYIKEDFARDRYNKKM